MKNVRSFVFKALSVGLLGFVLVQCGAPKEESATKVAATEEMPAIEEAAPSAEASAFTVMVGAYMELKDALVASDAAKAKEAAAMLEQNLGTAGEAFKASVSAISSTDDLEAQRTAFFELSKGMVAVLTASKPEGATYYQQYCPMAFNNTGALWVSTSKEVMNPYFGDKMLRCGKVEKEL